MATEKRQRQKAGRQMRLEQARAAQARRRVRRRVVYGVVLVAAMIALLFALSPDDDDNEVSTATSSTPTTAASTTATTEPEPFTYGSGPCPAADGSSPRTIDFDDAPQLCIDPASTYTAVFETTEGTVRVELDTATTPGAANNFVVLARYHYYDDTELFRTNTGIGIIQGGSPHTQDNGDPGPGYTIPDEGFGDDAALSGTGGPYRYQAGDLVYARPGGQPDSSSAQFFFCATDACSGLDSQGIYVKFGRVVEGLDVLERILESAPEGEGRPSAPVTVTRVTIEEA